MQSETNVSTHGKHLSFEEKNEVKICFFTPKMIVSDYQIENCYLNAVRF